MTSVEVRQKVNEIQKIKDLVKSAPTGLKKTVEANVISKSDVLVNTTLDQVKEMLGIEEPEDRKPLQELMNRTRKNLERNCRNSEYELIDHEMKEGKKGEFLFEYKLRKKDNEKD